eukprot:210649_1
MNLLLTSVHVPFAGIPIIEQFKAIINHDRYKVSSELIKIIQKKCTIRNRNGSLQMIKICYHCCIDANKTITKILDLSYYINRAYGFSHRYTKLNENIWMNLEGMSSQFPDSKSEFALIAHLRPLMRCSQTL